MVWKWQREIRTSYLQPNGKRSVRIKTPGVKRDAGRARFQLAMAFNPGCTFKSPGRACKHTISCVPAPGNSDSDSLGWSSGLGNFFLTLR